jgi:hypothetical protein
MCELDEQLERLKTMRQLVDRVRQCQCADLSICGRNAGLVMRTVLE